MFKNTTLFQSSCEARGLRNCLYRRHSGFCLPNVSILLRGARVAQRISVDTYDIITQGFNPLARRAGCATVTCSATDSIGSEFQSSCEARGLRNKLYGKRRNPALSFQSSCEARGLRNASTTV